MRHITPTGLALIQAFEGFSARVYLDVAGIATIGYGHVIKKGEQFSIITRGEAEILLRQDIAEAERAVCRLITIPLKDGQFDALVSFTYNLGAAALQRSTLRRKINRGEQDSIPHEFRRWVYAGGKQWPGLLRRREAEIQRYFA